MAGARRAPSLLSPPSKKNQCHFRSSAQKKRLTNTKNKIGGKTGRSWRLRPMSKKLRVSTTRNAQHACPLTSPRERTSRTCTTGCLARTCRCQRHHEIHGLLTPTATNLDSKDKLKAPYALNKLMILQLFVPAILGRTLPCPFHSTCDLGWLPTRFAQGDNDGQVGLVVQWQAKCPNLHSLFIENDTMMFMSRNVTFDRTMAPVSWRGKSWPMSSPVPLPEIVTSSMVMSQLFDTSPALAVGLRLG